MGWKDDPVDAAPAPWEKDAVVGQPNAATANKSFARTLVDALFNSPEAQVNREFSHGKNDLRVLGGVVQEHQNRDPVYGAVEGFLNAATGMASFITSLPTTAVTLLEKYGLGWDRDPKAVMEALQSATTYQPKTGAGQAVGDAIAYPFQKLAEAGDYLGHKAADATGSPGLGAITDATVQFLPQVLLGEFARKVKGQPITHEDMTNTAKVVAGAEATPEQVASVERSLHATYEKTGIGPYTVAEEAAKNPAVKADLLNPNISVPDAFEAYHGSPHDFEAFSTDAIGTGEGGAAFGHGLYFAEHPETAGQYAKNLSQGFGPEWDTAKAYLKDADGDPVRAVAALKNYVGYDAMDGAHKAEINSIVEKIETPPGNQYKVRITANKQDFLDWDKPLNQQMPAVQAAIKEFVPTKNMTGQPWPEAWDMTGGDLVRMQNETREDFSAMLSKRGVPGIRYFDQQSRTAGDGTRNYVLFDADHATIVEKNGVPVDNTRPALDVSGPTAEEAKVEGVNAGTVDLNMGASPKAYGESYTPYVGVEQLARKGNPLADGILKVFAPAARGELAEQQAGIMRANLGEMARQREVALEGMKDYAASFDKRTPEENYAFIDAMEKGSKLDDPKLQEAASALRALLDAKRDEVQALGKGQLENFNENYFPHIWKDKGVQSAMASRRPLAGSGNFLKERVFEDMREGLEAGFKPITDNPVELALLKAREMDRYIYGQKIFEEMKGAGLAKFVKFGDRAPEGFTKINDKVARVFQPNEGEGGGMILRGEYYAPDQAATLINNHLSPGLQGNAFFDAWRGVGMAMNAMQLGLSFFHVGFTTLDAMTSRVALGVKQMARGDVTQGAGNVAMGLTPAQPFINIYKGDKLLRAYLGKLDSPDLAPIVEAIEQAGGRVKMDDFYRNTTINAFKQALRANDALGAAKHFLPTVLDRMNVPVFEMLVPRQKLGVYFDMAKDWIEKNPNATIDERRAGLGKLWDSVDNRMGQLVYDNVFWNRALKDMLMATVRSVGWNLGTFRELGGGVADVKDIRKGLTDRTAYVIALPLLTGIYGAITNYLYTGEAPKELKDYFFPRTGRIRPDGSEDRVSLPTYMKDVYAYAEDASNATQFGADPTQTLKNKMHPLVATVSEMLNNEDFYGATIRNPSASAVQQVKDEANFLLKQIEPFSLRNYQQQAKMRGVEPSTLDYITSPSMVGIAPAPGYITKSKEELESAAVSRLRDPLIKKFRQEIKDGASPDDIIPKMLQAGMSRNDIKYVIRTSGDTPRPHKLKSFKTEERPAEATLQ